MYLRVRWRYWSGSSTGLDSNLQLLFSAAYADVAPPPHAHTHARAQTHKLNHTSSFCACVNTAAILGRSSVAMETDCRILVVIVLSQKELVKFLLTQVSDRKTLLLLTKKNNWININYAQNFIFYTLNARIIYSLLFLSFIKEEDKQEQ